MNLGTPIAGVRVNQVEPGTVITDERTGQRETVDETNVVMLGREMYITPRKFDALRKAVL